MIKAKKPNTKLQFERQSRGWTQKRVADRIDTSKEMISRWECGERLPSKYHQERLCALFQKSADQLGFLEETESQTTIIVLQSQQDAITHEGGLELSSFAPMFQVSTSSMDWSLWFGVKQAHVTTLVDHWKGSDMDQDQLQALIDNEITTLNQMQPDVDQEQFLQSRRQFISSLASLPMAFLSIHLSNTPSPAMAEGFLARCSASLTACWHLLKGSEIHVVEQMLSSYLYTLASLAHKPSRYQKMAAKLATQGYRLHGIVALHQNNLNTREYCCQQALMYSQITQEPALIVSALISLASTYYYENNPVKAAQTYRKALIYEESIHPLQRSRLYIELAVVCAQQSQEQESLHYLHLAQEIFPTHPEDDPSFLYAEFSPASMILEHGLTYLALAKQFPTKKYGYQALATFTEVKQLDTTTIVPIRIRLEIINHQAETALELHDQDQFLSLLTLGIQGAEQLKSKQRRQEVIAVYKKARTVWPGEVRISELGDVLLETHV